MLAAASCPALLLAPVVSAQMDSGMEKRTMPGGAIPADARDPHAYSDGVDFTRATDRPVLADHHRFRSLLIEEFEVSRVGGHTIVPYDLDGWLGQTYDRAVLKAAGEFERGELAGARTELLWAHAIAPNWDSQLGVRYDSGPGPNRTWLAAGIEGLAPYWFDLEVTAYVGTSNRTALRLDASYDLRITQRLILKPRLEANWYGSSDNERELGSGLAEAGLSIRLRYEVRRELAPYVGVEWSNRYGGTGALARAAGKDPSDTRMTIGLRFWF
jgi:copper resistance protein B